MSCDGLLHACMHVLTAGHEVVHRLSDTVTDRDSIPHRSELWGWFFLKDPLTPASRGSGIFNPKKVLILNKKKS